MKTKIPIKSIYEEVLFEFEKENNSIKDVLIEAIKQGANLQEANLQGANLWGANLQEANLWGANLQETDLQEANLRGANLRGADLQEANLQGANLWGANLRGANLQETDLQEANLQGANLRGADLQETDLKKIYYQYQIVPERGSFIGWKKGENNCIIELEIPAEAKRHNYLGGRKCRCEFAKVIDIRNSKGHKVKQCYNGTSAKKILYKIGEVIHPDSYDSSPLNDCSNGIHFFITRQEAKDW